MADAAAMVEQIGVEVGVADAVGGGLDLGKVDAEVAGALAHGGGGERLGTVAGRQFGFGGSGGRFLAGRRGRFGGRGDRDRLFLHRSRNAGPVGQRLLGDALGGRRG